MPSRSAYPGRVSTTTSVPTLAELTTLRVGGPADAYVEATSEAELIDTIRAADDAGEPLLVLGGGSNLLVSDEGFGGVVVRDVRTGFRLDSADACGGANVHAVAGQDWDELVVAAVEQEAGQPPRLRHSSSSSGPAAA